MDTRGRVTDMATAGRRRRRHGSTTVARTNAARTTAATRTTGVRTITGETIGTIAEGAIPGHANSRPTTLPRRRSSDLTPGVRAVRRGNPAARNPASNPSTVSHNSSSFRRIERMPPVATMTAPPGLQRSRGALQAAVKLRGGDTVLDRLRQEGCLKARWPRPERGAWTSMVSLNSAGGVAQGDWLEVGVTAGAGTRLTVASQAAERFYRSPGGEPARVRTSLQVMPGASLEWLPQETILFDGCALDRKLNVELAPDSWFLGVETLVFGRTLMGETVQRATLRDAIRVCRGQSVLLHDAIRLSGPVQSVLDRPAVAAGGRAVATLIHAAPEATARLEALRAALAPWQAGASVMDGLLLARVVAQDGACARAAIMAGLAVLRDGRPLPRVWSC